MNQNDNLLLKHFFILGITEENRENILKYKLTNNQLNASPDILSFYSIGKETQEFESIKNLLENSEDKDQNNYLKNNIFPIKSDYLENILNPDFEENIKDVKKVYSDYIIKTKDNFPPENFYHCFQYELNTGGAYEITLNFGVLIFYEKINSNENEDKDKDNNDDINIYLGKALVLISDKPIFYLMKRILEKIYVDFIQLKYSNIYLEPFIINLFNSLNNNVSKIIFKNDNQIDNKTDIDYCPFKDTILPFCDLNIEYIFQLFDINDILLLAEYYFLTKSLLIVSPNCEILFPIYHVLMTLFFPLTFHLQYYFYRLVNPDFLISGLSGNFSSLFFIYTDKNINNGFIDEKIINKFAEYKSEILVFQIEKSYDKETNKIKINIDKNVYEFNKEENTISKIPIIKYKNNTLLEKVMNDINNEYNYIDIIKSHIDIIKNSDLNSINSNFFSFSKNVNSLDIIRKNFLGLIIKFLVAKIEPLSFRLNEDFNKLEICTLKIIEKKENKKNNEEEKNENEKLKIFYYTPQSELIYKDEILKNNRFEIDFLKKQMLLDYFIKISKSDPNTLYFDEANFNFHTEVNNLENNKEKNNIISFDDLFDYNKYINTEIYKKNKIPKKQNLEGNNCYKIISIEELQKYLDINKEELNIFDKDIKNVLYFNGDFKLNFDDFNSLINEIQLNNDKNISYFNNIDSKIINENNNIKYYNLILYEAKIFNKIFYTINTVNRKELATCAIGLYISLYILYLLSKRTKEDDEKENKKDSDLIENITTLFDKLFTLFTKTKCFYNKYNLIIIIIYLILIIYEPLKIQYFERFLYSLQELKNVPSFILMLLYNNNIHYKLNNKKDEKYKEIKILFLEKKYHKHKFDIETLSGHYICKDKECEDESVYMWFDIVNNITNKKSQQNALNPIYLIKKLLNKIEKENSLFISDIENIDDIEQIAIWDEIYFDIRFFRSNYMDEIEY